MILLDTSVWIDLFRHRRGEISAQDYEDFVTCGPVLQEVVQGLRDLPASEIFRQGLLRVARLDDPMPAEAFLEAAEIYRSGRRRGYAIRSTVDCLIAAIAIRNSVPVWHKDRDYSLIARYTPLRAVTQIRQTSLSVAKKFQAKEPYCVAVGRPILAAAAFLRGARRLKSRLQPILAAPQGNAEN